MLSDIGGPFYGAMPVTRPPVAIYPPPMIMWTSALEAVMQHLQDLQNQITIWAKTQPAIRAILVVGSSARRDHPGDEWSDLDLMVFATDFLPYLAHTGWLDAIGTVWVCVRHDTGDGDPEQLVLFDGGRKADFVFYPVDRLRQMVEAQWMPGVYHRGYFTLVDKDGLAARLPPPRYTPPPFAKPSSAEFASTVNAVWYGAVYIAKQLRRRELWVAKYADGLMKNNLASMLAWHARATQGWAHDTWHNGRFISEWMEAETWRDLQAVFGHFEAADAWRALFANLALFRRLATQAALKLGYLYPTLLDERVTQFVRQLYEADSRQDG